MASSAEASAREHLMANSEKHPKITGSNGRTEVGARSGRRNGRAPWDRRAGAWAVALMLAVPGIFLAASLTTEISYWSRIVVWREARFDDFATKFPVRPIPNGAVVFHFSPAPVTIPFYLSTATYRQDGSE